MILCVFIFCLWSGAVADMGDNSAALPLAEFSLTTSDESLDQSISSVCALAP